MKKYDRFLRVVAALSEEKPDLKAVLVGDGPDREALQQLPMLSKPSTTNARRHFQQARIFVLTSRSVNSEGLTLSI